MVVLGIDPGKISGLAVLDTEARSVLWCGETDELNRVAYERDDGCALVHTGDWDDTAPDHIAYERVQSYGAGLASSLVDTAEIGGYCRHALGAVPMTRPETIRTLGLTGRGISKSAVWSEIVRLLGSDNGGKLCPKRNNKTHGLNVSAGFDVPVGFACPVCNGTGYERQPGPLAMFRGKPHARDALAVAVAYAIREGLL
jgi:hypothetical protein